MQTEQRESFSQKSTTPKKVSRFDDKWECKRCGYWNDMGAYPDCIFCGLDMNTGE